MVIQNPWAVTKALSPEQKTALVLNVVIGNLCQLASSTFAGTLMAWLIAGGQQMVNIEHTIAGVGIFAVSLFVGDRDLFSNKFVAKVLLYRGIMCIGDIIPMFFDCSSGIVIIYGATICMYPLMNGYRAERQNLIWGKRETSLREKQSFALRIHPLEMAVIALGGMLGMLLVPDVKTMSITYLLLTIAVLFMDIWQNYLLEKIRVNNKVK